ncbi:tetratricopeptide repeat protein [Patescibacteria group bacterium]
MAKRSNKKQKVEVKVGGADVVKRNRSSLDMVSGEKNKDFVQADTKRPSPKKRSFFSWSKKEKSNTKPNNISRAKDEKEKTLTAKWCDHGIRICLHLAIIVIPLLFLPLTSEPLELSKLTALYILAIVMLLLWLIKVVVEKKITYFKNIITIPVLVLLGVYLISSLFSLDWFASFFGYYGSFSGGFVELAALVIIFLITINCTEVIKRVSEFFYSFIFVYAVIVVFGLLQIFQAYIFPWPFAQSVSFNLVGLSTSVLAIFLAAGMGIVVATMFRSAGWRRILSLVISILGLLLLFLIDIPTGWIALVAVMVVLFAVVVVRMSNIRRKGLSWVPLIYLALGVTFILVPTQGLFGIENPVNVSLGKGVSQDVVKETLVEHPILGSGPETFLQDFNAHRPEAYNNSAVWNVRFDIAGTQVYQQLATVGILGMIAIAAVVLVFAWQVIRTIARTKDERHWLLVLGPFTVWVALTVVGFFHHLNITLFILLWISMLLSIAAVHYIRREAGEENSKTWDFSHSPQGALITSFVFLVILIGGIVSVYYVSKMFVADMHYKQAQEKLLAGDLEGAAEEMTTAARLNNYRAAYHLGASMIFMSQANAEVTKEDPDLDYIGTVVGASVKAAQAASLIEPSVADNWEAQGDIDRQAGFFTRGADEWAIDAYKRAITLDPNNPSLYNKLGKMYVLKHDRLILSAEQELAQSQAEDMAGEGAEIKIAEQVQSQADTALAEAVVQFKKAIELKQNLLDAHLSLGQTYDRQKNYEAAIEELLIANMLSASNPDLMFELGRIYYNAEQYDKSQEQFEAILVIVPDHANALFQIGLIYLQLEDKPAALEKFNRVLELNPDNEDVQQKIDEVTASQAPPPPPEEVIEPETDEVIQGQAPLQIEIEEEAPVE